MISMAYYVQKNYLNHIEILMILIDMMVSWIMYVALFNILIFFILIEIKDRDILFKEWIILSIKPDIIIKEKTLFSKVNAATERGKYIKLGEEAFNELFDSSVVTNKRTINRKFTMPNNCPTDIQAEILINEIVPKEYIQAIIVSSEQQAKEEKIRMKICQVEEIIPIIVSPELFTRDVYKKVELGEIISEKIWT